MEENTIVDVAYDRQKGLVTVAIDVKLSPEKRRKYNYTHILFLVKI